MILSGMGAIYLYKGWSSLLYTSSVGGWLVGSEGPFFIEGPDLVVGSHEGPLRHVFGEGRVAHDEVGGPVVVGIDQRLQSAGVAPLEALYGFAFVHPPSLV